ncbi:hypothetical protein PanWU01x14_195210 [Parasponia andersonii]|uniref:Uncharacterized protein n=1 Tax=Parasponia andersonii TaxID=3476 RepID=A0A2P5C048_PARAD|nr:hypothetical protein PanWU01x14_195210 [Parasponia andersonii]
MKNSLTILPPAIRTVMIGATNAMQAEESFFFTSKSSQKQRSLAVLVSSSNQRPINTGHTLTHSHVPH